MGEKPSALLGNCSSSFLGLKGPGDNHCRHLSGKECLLGFFPSVVSRVTVKVWGSEGSAAVTVAWNWPFEFCR